MTILLLLLASIVFNTAVLVAFKYFAHFQINVFKAIIYNYGVCIALGTAMTGRAPLLSSWGEPYLPYVLALGVIFIIGFNVAAHTVRYYGLTITTILQRTSMVITVIYAILVFNESLSWLKSTAILVAIAAIITINMPFKKSAKNLSQLPTWVYLLPLSMFLVNGIIDSILFHIEASQITSSGDLVMITSIFSCAAIIGIIFGYFWKGLEFFKFEKKTLLAAIALGLPNFFSIYFLLRLLGSGLDGSIAVPLNNIGILVLASILGYFWFYERLTNYKIIGLALAIISVILFSQVI